MSVLVRELMTKTVDTVSPDDTLNKVMEKLRADDIGVTPVATDRKLEGMITDRDIAIAVAANGMDPKSTPAREVMTDDVLYLYDDTPAEEAARNMGDQQVRRMPVVDREKNLVGFIGLTDFAEAGLHELTGLALKKVAA